MNKKSAMQILICGDIVIFRARLQYKTLLLFRLKVICLLSRVSFTSGVDSPFCAIFEKLGLDIV